MHLRPQERRQRSHCVSSGWVMREPVVSYRGHLLSHPSVPGCPLCIFVTFGLLNGLDVKSLLVALSESYCICSTGVSHPGPCPHHGTLALWHFVYICWVLLACTASSNAAVDVPRRLRLCSCRSELRNGVCAGRVGKLWRLVLQVVLFPCLCAADCDVREDI